jgi:hypothetical protein
VLCALAHTLPISFLTVVPDTEYLHLELTFNPFELSFARELDTNHNGRIDPQEWEAQQAVVTARLLGCLKVSAGGQMLSPEIAGVTPDLDSHHATLRAHYRGDVRHLPLHIESSLAAITSGSHLTQVTVSGPEGQQRAQLDMQSTSASFTPVEPSEPAASHPIRRLPDAAWLKWLVLAGTVAGFASAGAALSRSSCSSPKPPPDKSPL